MKLKEIEWKKSLVKSIIYRSITLLLGTLTIFIFTGSIALATGIAILTESVQAVNYFTYELIWSNIARKKIEKELLQKIKRKEIELKIDFTSIKDLAYELSQVDTFIPKLYLSVLNFFNRILENEDLEEIHVDIENYKNYFIKIHSSRKLIF
ncbi:MAG: DUF2061 domain-containing protein [Promethearchaeota archaeon]